AKIAQPTLYDGDALLKPTNTPVRVHDSQESLVQAEVQTDDNQIFNNVNHLLAHEMHKEEHLDSDVESDIDDNTIPYHQYQLDSEVQDVLTEVSFVSPGEISMITILDVLRNQLDGHLKVNPEQRMVNDFLRAELAR
nr:hypothetical protein [Tanacetum cinerariifolium]